MNEDKYSEILTGFGITLDANTWNDVYLDKKIDQRQITPHQLSNADLEIQKVSVNDLFNIEENIKCLTGTECIVDSINYDLIGKDGKIHNLSEEIKASRKMYLFYQERMNFLVEKLKEEYKYNTRGSRSISNLNLL